MSRILRARHALEVALTAAIRPAEFTHQPDLVDELLAIKVRVLARGVDSAGTWADTLREAS